MLDKLSGIFKTDLSYVAKGGFWLGIASTISSASGLVLVYFFANYLEPETYGTYRYILSVYGLLTIASLGGISTAVTRSVAKGSEGDFLRGFRIQVTSSLVATLVSF